MARLYIVLCLMLIAGTTSTWAQESGEKRDPYPNRGRYEAKLLLRGLSGLFSRAPKIVFAPATAHGGRLTVRDGLPVLELSGTPEQIGRQHGALMRRQLTAVRRNL